MSEARNKYLFKNTLIFTLGNIGSKIISFFLVPLYTNVLTKSQYGIVDLITTISIVAGPMLTLNICEAVMRFGLDKDSDKDSNTQIGSLILICAMVIGILIIPITKMYGEISEYSIYIYAYIFSLAASQLYLCDLRGKELLLRYAIGNILQTVLIAILNVIFLMVMRFGTEGYLLAYIIANFITTIYALIAGKGYLSFGTKKIDWKKMKEMVFYSAVLIPNTFMWWIMNSSDRVMVTAMLGVAANGIYAVSYKLPTLISVLSGIFNQAWTYSAIREEGSSDEAEYNNDIFRTLISFTMLLGIGLLTFIKPIMSVYVAETYYEAWKYTPFLIVGCVYLTLGTFMSTSYTVHKDSFGFLFSASFGAIFNIALNCLLIPRISIYGAALATCISYILVFLFRLFHTKKYIKYNVINKEFVFGSIIIIISAVLMFENGFISQISQLILLVFSLILYSDVWIQIVRKVCK